MKYSVIRDFQTQDTQAVVELWQRCDLTRPWNDPHLDIQRKLADSHPFWVFVDQGRVAATLMVGYDGHRGSVNYLAVDPACQRRGIARQLMRQAEQYLLEQGCPKLNLMVRDGNPAKAFYQALGYQLDPVCVLSQRLIHDD